MMKKLLFTIIATFSTVAVMAQPKAGTFSLMPRVGFSLATLAGDEIRASVEGLPFKARNKMGLICGVDADYQLTRQLSLSLGAHYVQQGCRYKNEAISSDAGDNTINALGFSDFVTKLHYINLPLLVNVYVAHGLALKTGVQIGFPLSGKLQYNELAYTEDEFGNREYGQQTNVDVDIKSTLCKPTIAIPVGVSYEFSNVVIDARYNIGLRPYQKIGDFEGGKNRVFAFTAAYRFAL